MSDYLSRLGARALGEARAVQPAIPPLFASAPVARPPASAQEPAAVEDGERGAPRAVPGETRAPGPAAAPAPLPSAMTQHTESRPVARGATEAGDAGHAIEPPPARRTTSDSTANREERSRLVARAERDEEPPAPPRVMHSDPHRPVPEPPSQVAHAAPASESPVSLSETMDLPPMPQPQSRSQPLAPRRPAVDGAAGAAPGAAARGLVERLQALGSTARRGRAETSNPPPTVQIRIGRVEVRAVHPPPPPPPRQRNVPEPSVTLTDYLRKRRGARS